MSLTFAIVVILHCTIFLICHGFISLNFYGKVFKVMVVICLLRLYPSVLV